MGLEERFKKYGMEYGKFNLVKNKLSTRRDLTVFLILDKLLIEERNIICIAECDFIFFDIDDADAELIAEDDIIDLCRCGVFYDTCECSLAMPVKFM